MASSLGYIFQNAVGGIDNVVNLLSTTPSVDLKSTGQTTLFTVPTGKSLLIFDIFPVVSAASAVIAAPIIRIGKASSYNEWLALTTLTALNGVNQIVSLNAAAALAIRQIFVAGDVIKVDVQTASTATTLTVTFYLFGILV